MIIYRYTALGAIGAVLWLFSAKFPDYPDPLTSPMLRRLLAEVATSRDGVMDAGSPRKFGMKENLIL